MFSLPVSIDAFNVLTWFHIIKFSGTFKRIEHQPVVFWHFWTKPGVRYVGFGGSAMRTENKMGCRKPTWLPPVTVKACNWRKGMPIENNNALCVAGDIRICKRPARHR
jgi:hypothetical protein